MPYLAARQREMLTLMVEAGHASNFTPARFYSAWVIRIRAESGPSVMRTFADSTGRKLLALGLIAPHSDPSLAEVVGPTGVIGRRYVATDAGVAEVKKREGT